jgi:uncharacterized protein YxjI
MKCGTALPAGASFCARCGSPVVQPNEPTPPLSSTSPPAAPSPAAGPSMGAALGLEGRRNFLVQHIVLSMGHSYRVMDPEKHHLFTVQGDVGQNLTANAFGNMLGGGSNSYLGRMAARSVNMTYTLVNAQGAQLGTILKEGGANSSTFTLVDSAGQRLVVVTLERGLMGGITAKAVRPDGSPILQTSGNLVRHNFTIAGPGGNELAKVHEAWVAVRDTYNVDLQGNVDPIYPLVFTILIDFEKEK